MMASNTWAKLDDHLGTFMEELLTDARRMIINRYGGEIIQNRPDGDQTRRIDADLDRRFIEHFSGWPLPLLVESEESGVTALHGDPQFAVVLDPLDGSELASRGFLLAAMAVSIVDLSSGKPVLSRIADIASGDQVSALFDSACHSRYPLCPSTVRAPAEAFLVCYFANQRRLRMLPDIVHFFERFRRVLNYGGPLDIARVAVGAVDACADPFDGVPAHEYLAGMHILRAVGGHVVDEAGCSLGYPSDRMRRQKFIAAGTTELAEKIADLLGQKRAGLAI